MGNACEAGLTVVASGKSTDLINTATKIAEAGAAVSDMIASGSQREFNGNAIKACSRRTGGSAASAVIGIIGVQQAAQKFSDDWVQMREYEVALKNALDDF